jgi:hypothetical protein
MITIKCQTLFDITPTGVKNRRPQDITGTELFDLIKRQQQQSNYDTLLQVISLRSQPESISQVKKSDILLTDTDFGFLYTSEQDDGTANVWSFTFTIQHASVFQNDDSELGSLLNDCEQVPMITNLLESVKLTPQLNVDSDLKNIHFEIVDYA